MAAPAVRASPAAACPGRRRAWPPQLVQVAATAHLGRRRARATVAVAACLVLLALSSLFELHVRCLLVQAASAPFLVRACSTSGLSLEAHDSNVKLSNEKYSTDSNEM